MQQHHMKKIFTIDCYCGDTMVKDLFFTNLMTKRHKAILIVSLVAFLVYLYIALSEEILLKFNLFLPQLPGEPYTELVAIVVIAVTTLTYLRGWKPTAFIVVLLLVVPWASEVLSIHTGVPFGNYYYTSAFPGPKILGAPVLLSVYYLGWYFFPAYFVSNLLVDGVIFTSEKTWWKRALFLSFIGSVIIAGIDMLGDPTLSTTLHQWIWTNNPYTAYYGIPYLNYLGYIIVMTPVFFLFRYYEIRTHANPMGPVTMGILLIPFGIYFLSYVSDVCTGPAGLLLVGCFTMLVPLILSLDKLVRIWGF